MATTRKRKPTAAGRILVTFLLDKSGSMGAVRDGTIDAFNVYLDGLQEAPAGIEFSFLQFNSNGIERIYLTTPIAAVKRLTRETYQPIGGTPLIEAATKTIEALEAALAKATDDPKVVVYFHTDGAENASDPEYSWGRLKRLVEAKIKLGWQINFMGVGIDAYTQSQAMGIPAEMTVSYAVQDMAATRSVFAASASNSMSYARGESRSTRYSARQKGDAGDAFDPGLRAPIPPVASATISVSLAAGPTPSDRLKVKL